MRSISIRPAGAAQLPGILAIVNEVIAQTTAIYTEAQETLAQRQAWFAARQALGYPVLVALGAEETDVLGFASFGDFRAWPGFSQTVEHSVHVRADQRGQGLGPLLVQALFPEALRLRKHVMVAAVDAANAGSIRLHERLGFERVALMPEVGCKFGQWLDLVLLQKRLDQRAP